MARKRSEAVRSVTSSSSAQSCRKAAEPPQTPSKPCGPRLLVKLPAMAKALAKSPRASVSAQLRDETSSKPNSSRPVGKVKAAASASVLYDSDDEPIPVPLSLAQERRLAKAAQSRLAKETPKTHRPKPTASKSPVYARQPAKIRAKERPPTPTGPGEHTPSSQASLAEVLDQVPEPEADLEVGSEASASHASQVIDQVAHNPALFPWLGSDEPPVATSTPLAKAAPAPRRRRGHSPPPKDAPPPKAPKAKAPRAMAPKATPAPAAATQARPIVPAAPAQRPPEGRPTAAALAAETGGAAEAGASEHIVDVDCLPGFRPFRVTVSGAGGPVGVSVEYLKEAGAGQATLDVFFKPTGPPKARPSTDANNNAFRNKSGFPAHAHKLIPGTKFAVDAFNNGYIGGVELYFLSHFHADHYGGLDRHFAKPILCTPMTANLAHYKLKVPAKHFRVLDIGKTYRLRDGTLVRLVDANHCPGAVLFLFLLPSGKTVLHTGDFRASPALVRAVSDELRRLQVSLDTVYLDTTYGRPEYAFPPTEAVLREVVDVVRAELRLRPNLLLVLGTYSIARAGSAAVERAEAEGKEAVVLALAEALDCAVCVSAEKAELWARMGDARLLRRAATQPKGARLHLVFGKPTAKAMEEKLKASGGEWSGVLGIWPSGWEHDEARVKATVRWRGKLGHLGLPYSEHSSFQELVAAVQAWRPGKIISTVGRKADREAAEKLLATAQAAKTQTSLLSFLNNQQDRKA